MTAIEKLQKTLDDNECVYIADPVNRRYLTGMKSSAGVVLVFKDYAYLIIDFRYIEKAREVVKVCDVIEQERLYRQVNKLLKEHNAEQVKIDTDRVTLTEFYALRDNLKAAVLKKSSLTAELAGLRAVKTEAEKQKIISAQRIAERAFCELLNFLKVGVSEREAALELNRLIFEYGAEDLSFETIALGGADTSVPHGTPGDYRLKSGDLFLFDFGAVYDGFHSDMTRTVAIGEPSGDKKKVYETVLAAQEAGIAKIKSGVRCSEPDAAARELIDSSGYKNRFGHSFGHGVGIEIHERPNLSPNNDSFLKTGMVVTAEPGIYIPGEVGVRIEDFGMVTDSGFENFTLMEKKLLVL